MKKVLIIEDEDSLGKSIKTYLEHYGYQATCIGNGVNVLDVIQEEKPDLILTDLLLPRVHGFDICQKVKADKEFKDIPLIVMTAVYKEAVHKMEARRMGADDFLEKPLDFKELQMKIENFLGPAINPSAAQLEKKRPTAAPVEKKKPTAVPGIQTEEDLKERFQALQKDYASRLPQKVMELETLWYDVLLGKDKAKSLAKLRRLVHNLAGSGTTFGFKELSENAVLLEVHLDMMIAEGENAIDEKKDQVALLLDNLRHDPLVSTEMEIMRQMGGADVK